MRFFLCVLTITLFFTIINSARILAVFSIPVRSHHIVYRKYLNALANRGHQIVVFSTNPTPDNERHSNITEYSSKYVLKTLTDHFEKYSSKRGIVSPPRAISEHRYAATVSFTESVLENPNFRVLLTQKFDMVITEAFKNFILMLPKVIDAPVVILSSFYGLRPNFEDIGVPTHPLLYPSAFRGRTYDYSSIWETLHELYIEILHVNILSNIYQTENNIFKAFLKDFSLRDVKSSADMLFLSSDSVLDFNRPMAPNAKHFGGIIWDSPRQLPEDLKDFFDNSKRGVIYVSLGSFVNDENMDDDFKNVFKTAFEMLPYDILWKHSKEIPDKPANVKIKKWLPQKDLLAHPNLKAFVTQAGHHSTIEAIYSGVPVVGVPIISDQWYNSDQFERLGIGLKMDTEVMTAGDLVKSILTVIKDPRYKKKIKKLGAAMRDQPQIPLERAVWWTEYILRHHSTSHHKSPLADISWIDYFMLDVVLVLLVGFIFAYLCVRRLFLFMFRRKVKAN